MGSEYRQIIRGLGELNGSYRVHFTLGGRTFQKVLKLPVSRLNDRNAINIKTAIDVHATAGEMEIINTFLKKPVRTVTNPDRIDRAITAWLDKIKSSKPHSTHNTYKRAGEICIKHLGHHTLQGLSENPAPIFEMIESMENLTLKTVRNYLGPLRAIFSRAYTRRQIKHNPFADFSPSDLIHGARSAYRIDPFDEREIALLIEHGREWSNYIQFNAYTGLRPSEMMGLEWADIDISTRTALVQRAVVTRAEKDTKTEGSTRRIKLLPLAEQALTAQKEVTLLQGGKVFINPVTGMAITDYEEINNAMQVICRRAKIRYRPAGQLRHSYASNRLMSGANLYDVADQMGHRNRKGQVSIEMVIKHYGTYIEQVAGLTGSYGTCAESEIELQAIDKG